MKRFRLYAMQTNATHYFHLYASNNNNNTITKVEIRQENEEKGQYKTTWIPKVFNILWRILWMLLTCSLPVHLSQISHTDPLHYFAILQEDDDESMCAPLPHRWPLFSARPSTFVSVQYMCVCSFAVLRSGIASSSSSPSPSPSCFFFWAVL